MVDSLRQYFTFVTFQQIPRAENKAADTMATLASLLELEQHESRFEFLVEELHYTIYDSQESQVICPLVGHESSRYGAIYSYLHDDIILEAFNHSER